MQDSFVREDTQMQWRLTEDHNWFILVLEEESPSAAENLCEWKNPEGDAGTQNEGFCLMPAQN